MKKLIFVFYIFSIIQGKSQENSFSLATSYPIATGDNFLSDYSGIAEIGLRYKFGDDKTLDLALGLSASFLKQSNTGTNDNFALSFLLVQSKLIAELNIDSKEKFIPFFGIGYSYAFLNNSEGDIDDGFSGININLGASYYFSKKWFAILQYDFVIFDEEAFTFGDEILNNNIALLKIGLGYRL